MISTTRSYQSCMVKITHETFSAKSISAPTKPSSFDQFGGLPKTLPATRLFMTFTTLRFIKGVITSKL